MRKNEPLHPRVPELLNMIGYCSNRGIVGRQIGCNLIGHEDQALNGVHSAGIPASTRRERVDKASYSSCHSVGPLEALI